MAYRALTDLDIQFFLRLGYFPHFKEKVGLDYSYAHAGRYDDVDESDLIALGQVFFQKAIDDHFDAHARHVVPISGGLDSRALLAGLLERTAPSNIETYTFGTPGSYDYEIGAQVAKAAGASHSAIDLTQASWSMEDLLEAARRQEAQTFLFHHVPSALLERYQGSTIWSGYIGDAVFGGHLSAASSCSIAAAKKAYWVERVEAKSYDLLPHDYDQTACLDRLDFAECAPDTLSFSERVLLAEVGKVTAPHIMPQMDVSYKTPFINKDLFGFGLSIPAQHRFGRALFVQMMCGLYPALFDMPTKSSWGLPMHAPLWRQLFARARNKLHHLAMERAAFLPLPPSPNVNFIDFGQLLRQRADVQGIVRSCFAGLAKRGCVDWLDLDGLYRAHMQRRANYGDALALLCSLEINLCVREGG